jgi:hypothetical protein
MQALFGAQTPTLDDTLEGLADFIEPHFSADKLLALARA